MMKVIIFSALLMGLAGCGSLFSDSTTSSTGAVIADGQNYCTQQVVDAYNDILDESTLCTETTDSTNTACLSDLTQSCSSFKQEIGTSSCHAESASTHEASDISYDGAMQTICEPLINGNGANSN